MVLGGPFLPHIEQILRDKALLMSSPVVLASDTGNKSKINGVSMLSGRPFQSCDIVIRVERDLKLVCIRGIRFYWVLFPRFCEELVIVGFLAVH